MELLHFALIAAVTACTVKVSHQGPNQERLYYDLMRRYNPLVRPVPNDTETLTVSLGLSLMQIVNVDEKKQELTSNIWLQMYWDDFNLQWDPEEYSGVSDIRLPEKNIWKPDIRLYNSADQSFDATFKTNILVKSSGLCTYIPQGIFKSTCSMDVRWFPFDLQTCELKLGSWTYGAWSLDLKVLEPDISGYMPNAEWHLVEVTGQKNERTYACCEEPYADVTFSLTLRRQSLSYGLTLLVPSVLMSVLALLVFLLPADSGEKISLGITVLLSLTVLMLLVAEITPPMSHSFPLIAQYLVSTMVMVGVSVLASVVVLQFHHRDPSGGKMSKWTRVILLNWLARFLQMKHPGEVQSLSGNKVQRRSLHHKEIGATMNARPAQPNAAPCGLAGEEEEGLLPKSATSYMEAELTRILEEVRYIAERFHDRDQNLSLCSEWKFAAAVIDRLCLVAFSVFTVLCTLAILMFN